MRKGYRVTLGILTVMIMITLTIGTSYSYYSVSDAQTNPNTVATTCFNVDFLEGNNGSIKLDGSNGNYAYPIDETDVEGKITPYEFTLKNTCTVANAGTNEIKYDITINTLKENLPTLELSKIRYRIDKKNADGSVTKGTSHLLSETTLYPLNETTKETEKIENSYKLNDDALIPLAPKIDDATPNVNSEATYQLYLWIDSGACEDNETCAEVMGRTFTGRVLIYNYL